LLSVNQKENEDNANTQHEKKHNTSQDKYDGGDFPMRCRFVIVIHCLDALFCKGRANGLRYLRWGGDCEAVQPEK
jgi:hypothetical protein